MNIPVREVDGWVNTIADNAHNVIGDLPSKYVKLCSRDAESVTNLPWVEIECIEGGVMDVHTSFVIHEVVVDLKE